VFGRRALMNNNTKFVVLVLVVLYFVAPDPFPSPIDDIIVVVMGMVIRKGLPDNSKKE
jgi:hypothetical protein